MPWTLNGAALVAGLVATYLAAQAASMLPSGYEHAVGHWFVRPSGPPLPGGDRIDAIARSVAALKIGIPIMTGFAAYLTGRMLARPPHPPGYHAALRDGAWVGAVLAALLLAWAPLTEWETVSGIRHADHRAAFVASYIGHIAAAGWLARGGCGLAGLIARPSSGADPGAGSAIGREMAVSLRDLAIGATLILALTVFTAVAIQ